MLEPHKYVYVYPYWLFPERINAYTYYARGISTIARSVVRAVVGFEWRNEQVRLLAILLLATKNRQEPSELMALWQTPIY